MPGESPITGYHVQVSPAGIDRTVTTPTISLTGLPTDVKQRVLITPLSATGNGWPKAVTSPPGRRRDPSPPRS